MIQLCQCRQLCDICEWHEMSLLFRFWCSQVFQCQDIKNQPLTGTFHFLNVFHSSKVGAMLRRCKQFQYDTRKFLQFLKKRRKNQNHVYFVFIKCCMTSVFRVKSVMVRRQSQKIRPLPEKCHDMIHPLLHQQLLTSFSSFVLSLLLPENFHLHYHCVLTYLLGWNSP